MNQYYETGKMVKSMIIPRKLIGPLIACGGIGGKRFPVHYRGLYLEKNEIQSRCSVNRQKKEEIGTIETRTHPA
jgi:hypothetical protein